MRARERERGNYTSSGCWPVLSHSLERIPKRHGRRRHLFLHRLMYLSLEGTCSSVWTPVQMRPGWKRWVNIEKHITKDDWSIKLGNVWVLVQLIFGLRWPINQLRKNQNTCQTWDFLSALHITSATKHRIRVLVFSHFRFNIYFSIWILRPSLRWSKSYGSPWWRLRGFDSEIPISICRTESSRVVANLEFW